MVEIEVCERLMDATYVMVDRNGRAVQERRPAYHAQIKDKPGIWGRGASVDEAVGSVIRNHPELFGIKIAHLEGKMAR